MGPRRNLGNTRYIAPRMPSSTTDTPSSETRSCALRVANKDEHTYRICDRLDQGEERERDDGLRTVTHGC